jgi:nucleoside-diphosphate-sugar epimerase
LLPGGGTFCQTFKSEQDGDMAEKHELPPEMDPGRYIEKVSLITGEVIEEPILPRHLLVHHHRDYHPADVQARRFMSKLIGETNDEDLVRQKMKEIRELGHRTSERIGKIIGKEPAKVAKALFGLKRKEYFFRYKKSPHTKEEVDAILARLKAEAEQQLGRASRNGAPAVRVLLTGGTGFVGQEIIWQAAHDPAVVEMVVLIRPKEVKDRKTGKVLEVHSPAMRGEQLLRRLWLAGALEAKKFRFIAGDVEEPNLGVSAEDFAELQRTLTHVIHCAASVAFDDPYPTSFGANVQGTLNALSFSEKLQNTPGSPFVAHLAIETSYIHGRQTKDISREDEIVFPRNFYNNYYELTKAMASIETERYMLDRGLRVVQLCPAIVIGESRAGNNRGDTKVVNAPVNVFGRAHEALQHEKGSFFDRTRAAALARMALLFPGDPTAEINLISVDRVVQGIIAALKRPQAVGERVHLATDNRLRSQQIRDIVYEELGVEIRLADPTTHRTITLPVLSKVLGSMGQEKLASALEKLGTIFGGYSEWGQPVHEVGNDVRVLGLSENRPVTEYCFRMLCRHNRYVQRFGKIKDLDEISRRERIWWDLVVELEDRLGHPVGGMDPEKFREFVRERLDPESFELLPAA